jgi:outer membrane protein
MLKKILLAVALALPVFGASAQSAFKMGTVDTQTVMAAMPETTEAQKKLADTSKKYEDEYARLGDEYKRLVEEYQNMKEDELTAIKERKTRELSDYQQKMQTFEQTAYQDLQKMQQELMAPIMQKIKTAVESVGQEGGFSLIQMYDSQLTLYQSSAVVDVTPLVKSKLGVK